MENDIKYSRDDLIKLWHIVREKLIEPKSNSERYSPEGFSLHSFLTKLEGSLRLSNFDWDHFHINLKSEGVDRSIYHLNFEDLALNVTNLSSLDKIIFFWRLQIGR